MPAPLPVRRIIYLMASFAPAWALVATFTGGVGWMIGPLRISSRDPLRPLLLGVIAAAYYIWRYTRDERAADGRWLEARLKPVLPWIIPVARHSRRSGSACTTEASPLPDRIHMDIVSQARLWLDGTLRVAQPLVDQLSWPNREWAFTPLGYRPYFGEGTIVPTYPAGLPMVMAVFLGLFGQNGPFFVVPLFAALDSVDDVSAWQRSNRQQSAGGSRGVIVARVAGVSRSLDGADVRRARGCRLDACCRARAERG